VFTPQMSSEYSPVHLGGIRVAVG